MAPEHAPQLEVTGTICAHNHTHRSAASAAAACGICALPIHSTPSQSRIRVSISSSSACASAASPGDSSTRGPVIGAAAAAPAVRGAARTLLLCRPLLLLCRPPLLLCRPLLLVVVLLRRLCRCGVAGALLLMMLGLQRGALGRRGCCAGPAAARMLAAPLHAGTAARRLECGDPTASACQWVVTYGFDRSKSMPWRSLGDRKTPGNVSRIELPLTAVPNAAAPARNWRSFSSPRIQSKIDATGYFTGYSNSRQEAPALEPELLPRPWRCPWAPACAQRPSGGHWAPSAAAPRPRCGHGPSASPRRSGPCRAGAASCSSSRVSAAC